MTLAVRSSATAEDLPTASFAGQHETFLNISGEARLLEAIRQCFASLFMDRAIAYRVDHGIDYFKVYQSVGVMKMVRSDLAASGVTFSLDTETGFRDVVFITGAYGLGENVVLGKVDPDEFYVFKPTLARRRHQGCRVVHGLCRDLHGLAGRTATFLVADFACRACARWQFDAYFWGLRGFFGGLRGERLPGGGNFLFWQKIKLPPAGKALQTQTTEEANPKPKNRKHVKRE